MENVYSTPQSELVDQTNEASRSEVFYVVARSKMAVLFFATLGLYSIYWFYRNWKAQKLAHGESMIPVMRAIFAIFFTHSLFSRVEQQLLDNGVRYPWDPILMATVYVMIMIGSAVLNYLSTNYIGSPYTDLATLVVPVAEFAVLYKVQRAINTACGDPDGAGNCHYTPANIIWIVIGVGFWAMTLFGTYLIVVEGF